jgi:PASTA domain
MPKTVKVFGHQVPRGVVIGGVVIIVAGGGYYLYKKSVAPQKSTTPGSTAYGYGQGSYGYGAAYGYGSAGYGQFTPYPGESLYGYGEYGYGFYGSGGVGGYYGSGFSPNPPAPAGTTNQQWAQASVAGLVAQGFDAKTVTTAIGLYLQGKALTNAQADIVTAAIGLEGEPPQSGAGGFPPAVHTTSTHHNPKPTEVVVPNVTGIEYMQAAKILSEIGLKAKRARPNVGVVASETPRAGTKVKKGSTVTLHGRVSGRKPGAPFPGGRVNG